MADRVAYDADVPVIGQGMTRKLTAIGGAVSLVAADLALNRTTALFKVPAGFTVVDHSGQVTDLDTNGSPTLSLTIGDAADADRFLTTSSAGRTGGALGAIASTGIGHRYDGETEIVLTASAAAATAAAGTITYFLLGYFD